MKRYFLPLSLLLTTTACQLRKTGSSELEHTFGQTRRDPVPGIEDCRGKTIEQLSPGAKSEVKEGTLYLRKVADQIMRANPNTFKDAYAPEKICVFVTTGGEVNAAASHEKRTVIFQAGMLRVAGSDAEVASVVAHELSHITMQHTHASQYEELLSNPVWKKQGKKLETELKQLQDKAQAKIKEQDGWQEKANALHEKMNAAAPVTLREERERLDLQKQKLIQELDATAMTIADENPLAEVYRRFFYAVQPALPRRFPIPRDESVLKETFNDAMVKTSISRIKSHNEEVRKLNAAERLKLPAEWDEYDKLLDQIEKAPGVLEDIGRALASKKDEIKSLQEKLVGGALYNWAEEEADDVGLELYLRAGWSPAFYSEIFRKQSISKKEDVAACQALLGSRTGPDRGMGPHPASCWRIYNATVLEMRDHKIPYKEILTKANSINLVKDALPTLQKLLKEREGF